MNERSRMYAEHDGRRYRIGFAYDNEQTVLSKHYAVEVEGKKVPQWVKARMVGCFIYDVTDKVDGPADAATGLAPGVKMVATGRAFCLPMDEYTREEGRRRALHRAVAKFSRAQRQAICKAYESRRTSAVMSRRTAAAYRNLFVRLVGDLEEALALKAATDHVENAVIEKALAVPRAFLAKRTRRKRAA